MKVICRPRQAGKTTEIIKRAADEFLYIVCINRHEVVRIAAQAKEMGLDIPFPVTIDEVLNGRMQGSRIKGFAVDNADLIIERLISGPVRVVSVNSDDKPTGLQRCKKCNILLGDKGNGICGRCKDSTTINTKQGE